MGLLFNRRNYRFHLRRSTDRVEDQSAKLRLKIPNWRFIASLTLFSTRWRSLGSMEQSIFKAVARLLPLKLSKQSRRAILCSRNQTFHCVCVWEGRGGHLEKSGLRFTDAFFFFFFYNVEHNVIYDKTMIKDISVQVSSLYLFFFRKNKHLHKYPCSIYKLLF